MAYRPVMTDALVSGLLQGLGRSSKAGNILGHATRLSPSSALTFALPP